VKVHAYGSSKTTSSIYGQSYLGYFNFMYILQALTNTYQTNSYYGYFYPLTSNQLIWRYPS
jgi:hypothetical protein